MAPMVELTFDAATLVSGSGPIFIDEHQHEPAVLSCRQGGAEQRHVVNHLDCQVGGY
jgi:hypothetical protein